jgi:serine/threonine protein kinase
MATVYLGRALGVGGFERLVAIKVMHPHLAIDREFVAMFLDEARLAARIRHPNVVATLDVQVAGEEAFLVMDYVEGPSLFGVFRKLRDRGERLPLDIALRITLDALAGLHAAHELRDGNGQLLQLVHRDVSPHNVLVGVDGVAKLADFGIARAEERISFTSGGQIKGKMMYMPPEQLGSGGIDRRADVYAAAVVLWESLTARRLFRAESDAALAALVLQQEPASPSDVDPQVPRAIGDVCLRALAKNREHRWASAAELADALEQAAKVSGVSIATTRALARFVEDLGAHTPAAALLASAPSKPIQHDALSSSTSLPQATGPSVLTPPALLSPLTTDLRRAPRDPLGLPTQGAAPDGDLALDDGAPTAIATAKPVPALAPAPTSPPRSLGRLLAVLAFVIGVLAMTVILLVMKLSNGSPREAASSPQPAITVVTLAPAPPTSSTPGATTSAAPSTSTSSSSSAKGKRPLGGPSAAPSTEPSTEPSARAPSATPVAAKDPPREPPREPPPREPTKPSPPPGGATAYRPVEP